MESRITMAFQRLSDVGISEGSGPALLDEWRSNGNAFWDKRNGIWCMCKLEETNPLTLYKNYINYINSCYDSWVKSSIAISYLDMGLVPIVWLPSFLADYLAESVGELANTWNIQIHQMAPSSLLLRGYVGAARDTWVKKEDFAKVLGVPIEKACLSTLLKDF